MDTSTRRVKREELQKIGAAFTLTGRGMLEGLRDSPEEVVMSNHAHKLLLKAKKELDEYTRFILKLDKAMQQ
jgi:hypothetical protein